VDHADCGHVWHGDGLAVLIELGAVLLLLLLVVLDQHRRRPHRIVILQARPLLQARQDGARLAARQLLAELEGA